MEPASGDEDTTRLEGKLLTSNSRLRRLRVMSHITKGLGYIRAQGGNTW